MDMNPSPKVITGPLHPDNKGACDWGYQGFLAYGCHGYIVVVDTKTLQIVQTVGPQKGNITHVRWSREKYHHAFATGSTYSLTLAAADMTGALRVWDIITGQVRTEFTGTQPAKPVNAMEWYVGHDASHDLLMVLRAPDTIEMWDAYTGVALWKKGMGEDCRSFTLDPFDIERTVVLCDSPRLLVLSDVSPAKEPSDNITFIQFTDSKPASGGRRKASSSSEGLLLRTSQSLSKMASLATTLLSSPEQASKRSSVSSVPEEDCELVTSCLQAVFSPTHRHLLLLLFPTELQILDIDVEIVLGVIRLDRSAPNFVKVIPCRSVDMMYCLHENGSASVRVRRQTEKQQKSDDSVVAMDMTYDQRCQSDSLRLLRQSKVYSFVYHPWTEREACIVLSDSRVIMLDVMKTEYTKSNESSTNIPPCLTLSDMLKGETISNPKECIPGEITLKFVTSGLVSGLTYPITMAAMAPSSADLSEAGSVVAIGSSSGTIQLVNVFSGQVEREYKLFMAPVRSLQWVGSRTILTSSYPDPPSYGNKNVKSEVVLLGTKSGRVVVLRESKSKEGPILLIRASPSRKFCALVVQDKRFELWDLCSRQLVREVSLHIIGKPCEMTWYPKVGLITKKVPAEDNNRKEIAKKKIRKNTIVFEQLFMLAPTDNGSLVKFVMLDDCLSDIDYIHNDSIFKIPGFKADLHLMAWKNLYTVFADRTGPLYLANGHQKLKPKKFSDTLGTQALKIQFAPGKDNMHFFVLYPDTLDIWNFANDKVEMEASSPAVESVLKDAEWTGPESVAMVTEDNMLHMMTIRHKKPATPSTEDDFIHVSEAVLMSIPSHILAKKLQDTTFSPTLLEPKTAFLLKYSLQCNVEPFSPRLDSLLPLHDRDVKNFLSDSSTSFADRCYTVARIFGDEFDIDFWRLFKYKTTYSKPDGVVLTSNATMSLDLSQWFSKSVLTNQDDPILIDLSSDPGPRGQPEVSDMDLSWLQGVDSLPVPDCGLDVMISAAEYKAGELSRLALCDRRRYDYRVKQLVASRWLRLNKLDLAVQGLMETESDNPNFRTDFFKACLSSCIETTSTSLSMIKLVATHLIAGGYIDDGVDLLCLIHKRLDACKYLISAGRWKAAVWLAKTSLPERECLYVMCKWAEHLWQNSWQKDKAVLLMLSMGQYTTVLRMLCELRQYDTAAMFLQAAQQQGLLPFSQHTNCVYLEFAKLLAMTEYQSAAKHYCQLAGESGKVLLADLQKTDCNRPSLELK